MTLVDAETGEVVEVVSEFTETEAREHTERINLAVGIAGDLVIEAWERRIWTTLGYSSWEDYCAEEIRFEASGQSKAVLMVGLRKAGASYRAIGAATGVSHEKARQELAGVNELTPEQSVTGTDGKSYPSTRPNTHTEEVDGETWLHDDDTGEAIVVPNPDTDPQPEYPPGKPAITKPDLGGGISHPARFSDAILEQFAEILAETEENILDPFAGTGRIHELQVYDHQTTGVEIEPEYAAMHEHTVEASALALPFDDEAFSVVATSPTYGNRLADKHNASDPELRRSYTHDLGRTLHGDNSGGMQWGTGYREFHLDAWREAVRVLEPGGLFLLNIKDHIRAGSQQPVAAWHTYALALLGLHMDADWSGGVATSHLRQGSTGERAGQELVLVFTKAVE